MIIVRGANFYCYEIEEVVNNTQGVLSTFAAVCAMDDPKTGTESMAVFFVPEGPGETAVATSLRSIQENITREFGVVPAYVIPVARDAFPKTTSGKIQRTQLKKRLATGEFDDLLRRIDLATGKNTVPAWFLRWTWRPSRSAPTRRSSHGTTLVIDAGGSAGRAGAPADDDLRGAGLVEALGDDGAVLVDVAEEFVEHGSSHFSVNPEDIGHLDRMVQEVVRSGRGIETVVVLNPSPGILLTLGQALATGGAVRLVVGVTHALQVRDTERPVPERAALRGLAETIPTEWHGIDVSLVDVTGEVDGAATLVAESRLADKARTVAYRDGDRLVPLLEEARFGAGGDALAGGDLVLVTGGLGGVGGELCKHLLVQHQVRLLVTGRSSLDTAEDGGASEGLGRQKTVAERRETLTELEALGEVLYRRADVTDRASMGTAVAEAEQRFGTRVRAAVHLAGIFPPRLLGEETPDSLAATLSPKLEGARCLDDLLPDECLIVLFGSVYGTFGAAACGGYAVANAALRGFAASRSGPTRLVDWSNWDDLGMSRGYTLEDLEQEDGLPAQREEVGVDVDAIDLEDLLPYGGDGTFG
ncbi:MAG: KR domain-containing protein, partial [Gemmatimonadota bacterium]